MTRILEIFLMVFVVVFIGISILYCVTYFITESKCLAAGYRASKIDYMLNAYCINRVDQTDIVVPIKEAIKK